MKKIVIIGAGVTGLCAGIFALKKGYQVSIYEKNNFAGGCCTGWIRDNMYIDNCMHWLTGTNQTTKTFKLWKKVGALSETSNLYQSDYFYKSIYNKDEITLSKDLDKFKNDLLALSIEDKKEINKLIETIKDLSNSHQNTKLCNKMFNTPLAYFNSYMRYRHLSLDDLAKKFKHPLIRKMFTDYLPKEYCALALIYAYATFVSGNGKIYSEGSKAFANNILDEYIKLGGFIHFESTLTKLHLNKDRIIGIEINNKDNIMADEFIYTGDPNFLFANLLPDNYIPKELKNKYNDPRTYPLYSSFHVAYAVDKKQCHFKDSIIFEIKETKIGQSHIHRLHLRDYSYLYHNDNKTVIQAFIPQTMEDYQYFESLYKNNPDEYEKKKNYLAKKIKDIIIEQYPEFKQSITILDCWTPFTYNQYFNSYYGSYMGFTFTKKASIKHIPYKLKNIKNFFLLSYWQKLSGGLPVGLELGYEISKML